jgi:hypothetical protein
LLVLILIGLLNLGVVFSLPALPVRADDPAGSDAAWVVIRAKLPRDTPVFRPTWLPERFRQAGTATTTGPFVGVGYTSDEGDIVLFVFGGSNTCATPQQPSVEAALFHGNRGSLTVWPEGCFPAISANWTEVGKTYSIQGNKGARAAALSREELLRVIAGLTRIEPEGQAVSPLTYTAGANCYPQTNLCLAGLFRAYFEAHGGVTVNGYPLTEEIAATLEDGRVYQVQYFERTRLEFHPEYAGTPYEVLLGQFGRRILADVPGAPVAPVAARPGEAFFPETGHNVAPRFAAYWSANGGLAQFGYPLSEPFAQQLEDGKTYTVQYFERARFELHPENAPPYDVLLGQFGRRILAESQR